MMKKNFSKYFMIAVVAVTMGFVSSCKDYNDEIIAEYRGQDAKLESLINNLDQLLDDLTTKHNQDIQAAQTARNEMKKQLEGLINTVKENQAIKDDAQSDSIKWAVDSIGKLDARIAEAVDSIKWTIDSIGKLDARVTGLEGRVQALENLKADERLETLENLNAGQRLSDVEEILGALEDAIGDSTAIATWVSDLGTLKNDVVSAKGSYESLTKRLESMQESINGIKTCSVECKALDSLVKKMDTRLDSIVKVVVDSIQPVVKTLVTDVDTLKNKVAGLETTVFTLDEAIKNIEVAYQKADSALRDSIALVREDLSNLEVRVAANEVAIEQLTKRLDKVEEDLEDLTEAFEKRISSISIQGAYSPVLGYFNMPMGLKSNVLAAYQGGKLTNTPELKFPFAYSESVVAGYETIDVAALEKLAPETLNLEEGDVLGVQNDYGMTYAGKVYMVVNPTEVDLTDVTFNVVNSLGENAPVALNVQPSDDKLAFGYTRAGVALYEGVAYVDAEETNVSFNVADYKEIFSNLKNRQLNVSDIVSTLYNTFNQITDANAVSATWTETLQGEEHEHTVMSDYALAAVSVKPLSFNLIPTLEGINFGAGTAIAADKVNKVIDRLVEKVQFDINIPGISEFDLNIERVEIDEDKFNISFSQTITIEGKEYQIFNAGQELAKVTIDGVDYPVTVTEDKKVVVQGQSFTVSYNNTDIANEIAQIESTINGSIDQMTSMVEQVNSMIALLQETETKLNNTINNAKNTIASKLMSGIESVASRMGSLLNKADGILRPVMLLNTTDGLSVLSQSVNRPVAVADGAVLVPTTYNAELLTPIYKKYVAVTKAWDKNGNEIDITTANNGEGFNEVLDGDVHSVVLDGETGYKYEITYSALDFYGYVVNTKYYVTIK